jgi:deoxyribodipyrimidine photo-lyase
MVVFWHRRDLRVEDNAGLSKALQNNKGVQPIFIFDKKILDELPENDQRVRFIYQEIQKIKKVYREAGSDLWVFYDQPANVFRQLLKEHKVEKVYTNRDYEPYAKERDKTILELLREANVEMIGAKDHVIFEKSEILTNNDEPYKVYSPYMRKWKELFSTEMLAPFACKKHFENLRQTENKSTLIALEDMGFSNREIHPIPSKTPNDNVIKNYHDTRDIPSINGTTRMSVHLRFGTISIRQLAKQGIKNEKYFNELIWRDFYQMIIHHFPHSVDRSFKTEYDKIPWENNEKHFQLWCEGKTGYPIVDAGMRELNQTGFMHNRVRMIVASFLTKHLLIDWRWGEAYFAEKLLDFELASNVGGWQWAASSGVDAQPYFRVFNPYSQQEKFDKDKRYIKKWVPEFGTDDYPDPIVEHKAARQKAIDTFKEALKS